MNLSQLETAVANELGLSVTDEATVIDTAINVAVQRVLEDTKCYVTTATISGFDGTSGDWSMPSQILEIDSMYFTSTGTNYRLDRLSVPDLMERRRVSAPTNSPTNFFALAGANLLMFWPTPSTTDTITLTYVPIPTALSASADDPSDSTHGGVPQILHEAIFFYACKRLGSYDDDQSSAQGQRYSDWYDKEILRYHKIIRSRGGQINARAEVNARRRIRAPHDNSVYPRS